MSAIYREALTDPDRLADWFANDVDFDLRPGGAYRFCMRSPEGVDYWVRGVYRDVVPPERLSFTIGQPSGALLTDFRKGSGPHTGVHVIIVRSDLGVIIHKHPPVAPDWSISEPITLPTPGKYRVVIDAYPNLQGPLRNFQLFGLITVPGRASRKPLGPFERTVVVDGYRFTLQNRPRLQAISPAFLTLAVTRPDAFEKLVDQAKAAVA